MRASGYGFSCQPPFHKRKILRGLLSLSSARKRVLREVLIADGAGEAQDGLAADGGGAAVGGCRVRAAMHHGVRDFHAGGEAIEDEAADFGLQYGDEFGVVAEVVFGSEDGCCEVPGQRACGGEHLVRDPRR